MVSTPSDLPASAAVQTLYDRAAERNLDGLLGPGVVSDHDSGDQLFRGHHAVLQACQPARGGPFPHLLLFRVPVQPAGPHLVRCRPCVQILQVSFQLHFLVGSQNLGFPVFLHPPDPIHTQAARALRAASSKQGGSLVTVVTCLGQGSQRTHDMRMQAGMCSSQKLVATSHGPSAASLSLRGQLGSLAYILAVCDAWPSACIAAPNRQL